jgi:hypothetical protein
MFSIMLLAIATVALGQFALYYWRAVLTGIASQPVSSRVFEAAQVAELQLHGNDFEKLASLHALTPELNKGDSGLGVVRAYYLLMSKVDALFGKLSPALMNWSERERVLCARYAAVQIEHRMQSNLAQAAAMRSC